MTLTLPTNDVDLMMYVCGLEDENISLKEIVKAYRAFYKGVLEKDNQAVEKAFARLTELGE